MKTAKSEQLTIPDYAQTPEPVRYNIDAKSIEQKQSADFIFYEYEGIFSLTFDFSGDFEVSEELAIDGVYLQFYRTGGIYIVFYEKYTGLQYRVSIDANEFIQQ